MKAKSRHFRASDQSDPMSCCSEPVLPGGAYCKQCSCAVEGCLKMKKPVFRRPAGAPYIQDLCRAHGAMIDAGTHYICKGCIRERDPDEACSMIIAVGANSGWLSDPCMVPCDIAAFDAMFGQELERGEGFRGNRERSTGNQRPRPLTLISPAPPPW